MDNQNQAPNKAQDAVTNMLNTTDETANFDPADIQANKGLTILAYFGPLLFIPMFATNNSRFARFHCNQGLLLLILEAAVSIIGWILGAIANSMLYSYNVGGYSVVNTIRLIITGVLYLGIGALAIIGIINVVNGKAKRLPIIGKINIIKY